MKVKTRTLETHKGAAPKPLPSECRTPCYTAPRAIKSTEQSKFFGPPARAIHRLKKTSKGMIHPCWYPGCK